MSPRYVRALSRLRSAHARIFGVPSSAPHLEPHHVGPAANDAIRDRLLRPEPCMVCRFGRTELTTIDRYLDIRADGSPLRKSLRYVRHRTGPFWWDDEARREMRIQSGFFPSTDESLARFCELMLAETEHVDVLGTWQPEELRVAERFPDATIVPLADLEPYLHARPWSEVLEGRTVLVIHPFEESIRSQFARREEIFPGRRVLPPFELKTLRAVQSVVGTGVEFDTWFEALDRMCEQVSGISFDVAIIGAGAYGFPLAAHVKKMGRQAVHLGGATQLLFGIRGKRWDDRPEFHPLFNEAWVHPSAEEVPTNYKALEQGAYW